MKSILPVLLILNSGALSSQIKNNGFEVSPDSNVTLPIDWSIKQIAGFDYYLDKETKYTGTRSFFIKSSGDIDPNKFIPFSQIVDFDVPNFKKIAITVYVKTKDIRGNVGVWCQIWDKDNKIIGFQNLESQKTRIEGSNDWKKYSLSLVVNSNCKKLKLGGFLEGDGFVWFDDFSIENLEFSTIPPSKEALEYIDDFVRTVKKHSLYSKQIDWKSLNSEIALLSKGASNIEDARVVASHVLNKLREQGDNHSFIQQKSTFEKASKTNLDGRQPFGKLLDTNIGYVYVPGFASLSDTVSKDFSKSIQNIIRDLDSGNNLKGWIVDLRENTGGNMWPMITGLGPIIGKGTLGYFMNAKGKVLSRWYYSKGSKRSVKMNDQYVLSNPDRKVAVLIGPQTASSGEMTLISFIGRPATKIFGLPSAGYTTSNSMYNLKDGSALLLASSYASDRNRRSYISAINPEILVEENADILRIAESWINEK